MTTLLPLAFRQRCERIAIDWRWKLGNRFAYDPLPALELLNALQAMVLTFDDVKGLSPEHRQHLSTISAFTYSINPVVILHNPQHSPARYESNMMHECAHILLKHPMILFDPALPNPPRDPQHESEATYLGGCLQIPKRGLFWAVQRKMAPEQIAGHFGASCEMVRYRANMSKLKLMI